MALAMAWAMGINPDPYCCKTRDKDMFLCGVWALTSPWSQVAMQGTRVRLFLATLLFSVLSLFIVHKASHFSHYIVTPVHTSLS